MPYMAKVKQGLSIHIDFSGTQHDVLAMRRKTSSHPWSKAKRVFTMLFREVFKMHPHWTLEDIQQQLGEDYIPVLDELAIAAGFRSTVEPTKEEFAIVEARYAAGVYDAKTISETCKIPLARVLTALNHKLALYGISPYGASAYGSNRQISDGSQEVPRKITAVGQLYYRGRRYSLGIRYRARYCKVLERDQSLIVSFENQEPVCLTRRR